MKAADFRLPPCSCPECRQAGVDRLEQRRDPRTGAVLHGHELRRWYEARAKFMQEAREAVGKPGRHAAGFEKLAQGKAIR
jgi:hypothetical protein